MQVQRAQNLLRAIATRNVARRNASHYEQQYPVTTLNDLPNPQGSWQTQYDAQQRKYNAHLLLGIGFTIGSIIIARASGLLYLNYNPPAQPADEMSYD